MNAGDAERIDARWLAIQHDLFSREPSEILRILTRAPEPFPGLPGGVLPVRPVLPDVAARAERKRHVPAAEVLRVYTDARRRYKEAQKAAEVGRRRGHDPLPAHILTIFDRELAKRGFPNSTKLAAVGSAEAAELLRAETGRLLGGLSGATVRDRVAEGRKFRDLARDVARRRQLFLTWVEWQHKELLDELQLHLRDLENLKPWYQPPSPRLYDEGSPAEWAIRRMVAEHGPAEETWALAFPGPGKVTLTRFNAKQRQSVSVHAPGFAAPELADAAEAALLRLQ